MTFAERLAHAVSDCGSPLCVGIDPWVDRLPRRARLGDCPNRDQLAEAARSFGLWVVEAASGRVAAVKPQFAFFEALGWQGMRALAEVCEAARTAGLVVVGDAKRGDIGSTAEAYAAATLGPGAPFPCDALTVNPWLGPESLGPFVRVPQAEDKGIFVLLRTSNPESARWQAPVADDLANWLVERNRECGAAPYGPVGAVVGATQRGELAGWRERVPNGWLLVPGFGAQGGSAAEARTALDHEGLGALIVSARGATFPASRDPGYDLDPAGWMARRIDAVKAELATP